MMLQSICERLGIILSISTGESGYSDSAMAISSELLEMLQIHSNRANQDNQDCINKPCPSAKTNNYKTESNADC